MAEPPARFPAPCIVLPKTTHTHTIFLLHGRGSTGEEFASEFFESLVSDPSRPSAQITLPQRYSGCKWVFPTTKKRRSSVMGVEMTEWFDTVSLVDPELQSDLQREGLSEAVEFLDTLLDKEMEFLPPSNIVLGGISQGFATASHVLISRDQTLAAFVGLSGWVPFASQIRKAIAGAESPVAAITATDFMRANLKLKTPPEKQRTDNSAGWSSTPFLLAHERNDPVVSYELGMAVKSLFESLGARIVWRSYDSGDHWIKDPEEIEDLVLFLDEVLKPMTYS